MSPFLGIEVRLCEALPETVRDKDGNDVKLLGIMIVEDGRQVFTVRDVEKFKRQLDAAGVEVQGCSDEP